jgi:hypothetical protein
MQLPTHRAPQSSHGSTKSVGLKIIFGLVSLEKRLGCIHKNKELSREILIGNFVESGREFEKSLPG